MKTLGILSIIGAAMASIALIAFSSYCSIKFERHCKGYLKHAADANTIVLASQELTKAVNYIEESGLTDGSTHFLYDTPRCDMGFWYQNLKAAQVDLNEFPKSTSHMESSNQLMKLRETIMDASEKGTRVTLPPNISIFPHQVIFKSLMILCMAGFLFGGVCAMPSVCAESKT